MPLPELDPEQRRAALVKAAEARRIRAELKQMLKAGEVSLRDVIDRAGYAPTPLAKMKVADVLEAMPAFGPVKARRLMEELDIAPSRRLRGLGPRQTRGAAGDLRGPPVTTSRPACWSWSPVPPASARAPSTPRCAPPAGRGPVGVGSPPAPPRPGEIDGVHYRFVDRADLRADGRRRRAARVGRVRRQPLRHPAGPVAAAVAPAARSSCSTSRCRARCRSKARRPGRAAGVPAPADLRGARTAAARPRAPRTTRPSRARLEVARDELAPARTRSTSQVVNDDLDRLRRRGARRDRRGPRRATESAPGGHVLGRAAPAASRISNELAARSNPNDAGDEVRRERPRGGARRRRPRGCTAGATRRCGPRSRSAGAAGRGTRCRPAAAGSARRGRAGRSGPR